jgi:hypothetical protein
MAAVDQTRHLRLVETLAELRTRLRARANALAEVERQRVVRLLVHQILVGKECKSVRLVISSVRIQLEVDDRRTTPAR